MELPIVVEAEGVVGDTNNPIKEKTLFFVFSIITFSRYINGRYIIYGILNLLIDNFE